MAARKKAKSGSKSMKDLKPRKGSSQSIKGGSVSVDSLKKKVRDAVTTYGTK